MEIPLRRFLTTPAGAAAPVRALVVDDDPLMQRVLRNVLERRGYEVDAADGGETALALLRQGGHKLVLLDRQMPGMDGLALCRAIRALPGDSYVYCIMLTSEGAEESLVAAMAAGANDFLAKPLRLPELGARLQAAERVLSLEDRLAVRNRELGAALQRLRSDLELARTLQERRQPVPARLEGVRFDAMLEASGFVGGDFCDYLTLDEGRLCFWQADVAGHGVAAAMLAFHAQLQLRDVAQNLVGATPAHTALAIAGEFNRRFLQLQEPGLYLTLLLGVIDRRRERVALLQAGHPAPWYAARAGDALQPVGDGGVPVGMLADPGWEALELPFAAGARLVGCSDGVTDCCNPAGVPFGEERLRALLQGARAAPLAAVGAELHAALLAWHGDGPLEDDASMLGVEVA